MRRYETWKKKIIISLCVALLVITTGFLLLEKYYQCNPLPNRFLMWQLEKSDGQPVEMFGSIITPSYDYDGNISVYSQVLLSCDK